MISQRAPIAENGQTPDYQMDRGGRSQMVAVWQPEYSATPGHASVAGDMMVSCKVCSIKLQIKVAPRIRFIRP